MRKNWLNRILIFTGLFVKLNTFAGTQVAYYVSNTGNDENPGTLEQPFASIVKARNVVRIINKAMTGDIIINLRGGTYEQKSTFTLTSEDSGNNGYNIIYQAYNYEIPILSGGVKISNWTIHDATKNIYQAKIDTTLNSRQLYVNGVRAIRARSIDASGWLESGDGYTCPEDIAYWKNITKVEIVSHKEWKCHRGSIASINGIHVVMDQPYWKYLHLQYDAPPVWIENAYELLDSEGEWYLDRSTGMLYYKPRTGENMSNAEVILPKLETLVNASNLKNIQFKGLTFSYATWLFPNSNHGFPCTQADLIDPLQIPSINKQIPGNIVFDHCKNLRIQDNTFIHLGVSGLQLFTGCKNNLIYNNSFEDISGSAISIGNIKNPNPNEIDLVKDITVENNLIKNIAIEYEGCVGILVGYTEHTVITHNEIRHLPYTGISVGWGYHNNIVTGKNNEISYNLIDSIMLVMKDGGGIYTLSSQPGAQVHDNFINHQFNTSGSLYPDLGSSNMKWSHNVVSNTKRWLHLWNPTIQNDTIENNFYDNESQIMKGTNCIVQNNVFVKDNNWPAEALLIMKNAGRINIPVKAVFTK
ncbi:MAG TPA: right-handed parallel beta-helix repeat-containing protein [Candidatus Paceibacterota bacterium]